MSASVDLFMILMKLFQANLSTLSTWWNAGRRFSRRHCTYDPGFWWAYSL